MSFVWADQVERLDLLRHALEVAGRIPIEVAEADAGEWVREQLQLPLQGVATVVFHSIVMKFMGRSERSELGRSIEQAGQRATEDAPLAWLRMEGGGDLKDVLLTTWPSGRTELLARAGLYGRPVVWVLGNPR
jgi:hypothetical protein